MTRNAPQAIEPAVSGPDRSLPPDDAEQRSRAFDLAFNDVFRNIEQKGRDTITPFLAVLGPTGSGKSLLLSRIAEYLDSRSAPDTYCHINVNLRRSALADLDQMHFDLVRAIYAQVKDQGSSIQLQILRENARYTFVSYLREILQSIDKCVMIYIDHSDYVPRFFARCLAAQFRDILEKEDLYTELKRVGLVWSGAMSLFGLKQEVDSAFSMCKTIVTPFANHEQRKLLICDQLERGGFVAPSEVIVDYLAVQTGGEPAFVDPIIRVLRDDNKKGRRTKASLMKLMDQLSDPTRTVIPELKEIALNVHLDPDLREIVDRLLNGSMAPCREPAVDVDQYHLKGAVILDKGTSRAGYSFRNGLVAQFLRNLLGQPAVRQVKLAEREAHEDGVLTFPGPLNKIRELRRLEEQLEQCFDLKEATALIADAWSALTECGKPTIAFCVRGSKIIWFGPARGEPTNAAPFATTNAAAAGAFSARRAYFAFDDNRVSVGLPLQYGANSAAVTATVERSGLQVGLSEMSVQHWAQFVTEFDAHLITLCMSALGLQQIAEMQRPMLPRADVHSDHAGAFTYVLCFAYDCRGNPLADAMITFELVDGEARTLLGEIRTTADRARPARVIVPRVHEKSRIVVRGSYAGQKSKPIEVDAANCWSCEFVFHIDDGEEAWKTLKRRTGWRCRHPNMLPDGRSVPPPAGEAVFASKAAGRGPPDNRTALD